MRNSYSLYELNEYIRRVVALNFSEPVWVHAEIAQVKEVRGNVYLDLIHHEESSGEVDAQIAANIWFKSFLFLKNKLGPLLPSILCAGSQVLVKAQVEFHERYGIKLIIEDIDPAYTIGQMEINRQKILLRLQEEGLTEKNKQIAIPRVLQKIAVISAENAAGYIDFIQHLRENPYGYGFPITLFPAAMQGQNTEREVCAALDTIRTKAAEFDCVVLIRGGGSKMDLAWFDNFAIGAAIARFPIPVLTGIGHDIDSTVADIVAGISCKTPTAVADFLIQRAGDFESEIHQLTRMIIQEVTRTVRQSELQLQQTTQLLRLAPANQLREGRMLVDHCLSSIFQKAGFLVDRHHHSLTQFTQTLQLLHPEHVLKRGFAIIRQGNVIVSNAHQFHKQTSTEIEFFDGKITIPGNE